MFDGSIGFFEFIFNMVACRDRDCQVGAMNIIYVLHCRTFLSTLPFKQHGGNASEHLAVQSHCDVSSEVLKTSVYKLLSFARIRKHLKQ